MRHLHLATALMLLSAAAAGEGVESSSGFQLAEHLAFPPGAPGRAALDRTTRQVLIRLGAKAAHQLQSTPEWRADRGLSGIVMARLMGTAFPPHPGDDPVALRRLIDADARIQAGEMALRLGQKAGPAGCAALDLAAERSTKATQLLAARIFVSAAAARCGPTSSNRRRVAQIERVHAQMALDAHRPKLAVSRLRVAFVFGGLRQDRARLADTLAGLAVAAFRADDIEEGTRYLAEARATDPLRDAVVAAGATRPQASPRARAGLLIIIIGVGFFAFRRLKRVLTRPSPTPKLRFSRLRARWRI